MLKPLEVMKLILARHKERREQFQLNKCVLGVRHSDQMIFDWTVRIFAVESFGAGDD